MGRAGDVERESRVGRTSEGIADPSAETKSGKSQNSLTKRATRRRRGPGREDLGERKVE